jgi:hypothetical protein
MPGCHCLAHCSEPRECESTEPRVERPSLFNWVTVILVTMWVGIVAAAAELAGPDKLAPVPTLEAFIRTLL